MKYFVNVLVDVLGAVYQAAGASLLIAVYAGKEAGGWTGSQSVDLAV